MNVSQIILAARYADSFSSIIPLTSLQTHADVQAAREKNIDAMLTESEFREKFPGVDCAKIYFGNILSSSTYYWDPDTMVIFPVPIIQGELFSTSKASLADSINHMVRKTMKQIQKNDYRFIVVALNDRMRSEYLKMLIDKDVPCIYELFKMIYPMCDFGCSALGIEGMQKLVSRKTEKESAETMEHIKDLPEVITVYRGEGSASAPYDKAFSWSLESAYALFFAVRLSTENSHIYRAKVNKSDIIEFFEEEKEVVVLPDKVHDIERFDFLDFHWMESAFGDAEFEYRDYLDWALYDKIPFEMASDIHNKMHCARVLLYTLLISDMRHLSWDDRDILAEAALYHDTGRTSDREDKGHGAVSAKKYKREIHNVDPLIVFLMRYHCRPDAEGYAAIQESEELRVQKDRAKLLLDIFKDADALDRFRLGRYELDWEQLRTEEARRLPLVAWLTVENDKG